MEAWPREHNRLRVLTTIFPIYDLVRTVGGDDVSVRNLLPPGVDPHEFALSPRDVELAAGADVILANGAGLDDFIGDALRKAGVAEAKVTRLSDGLPLIKPGVHNDHSTGDPHVWLDPVFARIYIEKIVSKIIEADNFDQAKGRTVAYRGRGKKLSDDIAELSNDYARETDGLKNRSFIAFHGAFAYLAKRYGLDVAAVWQKSPGREPSPKEVTEILRKARALKIRALFAEPQFSPRALEMIAADARIPVYTLDPLETAEDFEKTHYVDVMRRNLETLVTALGSR
jgi:zinc transport system substrate-binding protein